MNYITLNEQEIFKETARLFPPGFPKTEDYEDFDINSLGDLVDDLSNKVVAIQNKIKELKTDTFMQNSEILNLATSQNLKDLKESLHNLKTAII